MTVAFPTSLVRAALVCRRWLRLASAPAFLRRFRDLHPPSLLGFYVLTAGTYPPRFVSLRQPPELSVVVSRASFDLDSLGSDNLDVDCCNGLLLLTTIHRYPDRPVHTTRVRSPLYPARDTATLPPVPNTSIIHGDGITYYEREIIPKDDGGGGDGMSYFCLALASKEHKTVLDVYALQDDAWAIHSSALSEIPRTELLLSSTLIGNGKIYNLAFVDSIHKLILLDLVSSSLSAMNFPEEMKPRTYDLSLADDCRLHLIHVKGSQHRIWLHKMDDDGVSDWLLEGTICLREICANCMIPTCTFKDVSDSSVKVRGVVLNSEFVFLEMDAVLYLFDIKHKAAKKLYEITPKDKSVAAVIPFMMPWPPKFPVMVDRCDPK